VKEWQVLWIRVSVDLLRENRGWHIRVYGVYWTHEFVLITEIVLLINQRTFSMPAFCL